MRDVQAKLELELYDKTIEISLLRQGQARMLFVVPKYFECVIHHTVVRARSLF